MQPITDRDRLYYLEPLQPRILLSAAIGCGLNDAPAGTPDYFPPSVDAPADAGDSSDAALADDTSVVDDGSGDVPPDGIMYIKGFNRGDVPVDEGSADATDVVVDDSGDVKPDGIFHINPDAEDPNAAGDVSPDGIMYTLGDLERNLDGATDDGSGDVRPDGIFHINPDAEDPTAVDDVKPDGIFHINPDAEDPTAAADGELVDPIPVDNSGDTPPDGIMYMMGGIADSGQDVHPDGIFHINPDAQDPTAIVDEPLAATSAPAPAAEQTPAPAKSESPDPLAVTAPAASEKPAAAPEANPLLSKKDDLLVGSDNLLS